MDEIIEFSEQYDEIQFLVSLDYSQDLQDPLTYYSCNEWASLYPELGEFGNNPLILDMDPGHDFWNMFSSATTYSAYAFIDHNMVLRYKFDMPNLYDFQYIYIPNLLDEMYDCIDPNACNYDAAAVFDDGSCLYDECDNCSEALNQSDCMLIDGCMWMGDHCMESTDNCMDYDSEFECMNEDGCYWMGNHCMSGSACTDPIAFNYNPIADAIGNGDDSSCLYSQFIMFGCTYESAINFNPDANVDDGSCEYSLGDLNQDGILDVLDVVALVNTIMNFLFN